MTKLSLKGLLPTVTIIHTLSETHIHVDTHMHTHTYTLIHIHKTQQKRTLPCVHFLSQTYTKLYF